MKTTLEIPDALFRKAKATAAQQGQTLKEFVTEALTEKLTSKDSNKITGWRATLEMLTPELREAAREVDAIVNAPDFREIDEEGWK